MSKSQYITLGGGLDLVTPPHKVKPGSAISAINYECPVSGGYRRIEGYTQQGPEVPGEGSLLGVATFNDKIYAVRKDAGADSATLYVLNTGTNAWDTAATGLFNGRHEFDEGNLYATSTGRALYGVGGGQPFELKQDGTFAVLTGAQAGAILIAIHANHLFLGFEIGSLQFSSLGDPHNWDAVNASAGEIGVGDRLNGITVGTGGVLHVLCRDSVKTLRGNSSANFAMENTVPNAGARLYSVQSKQLPYFITDLGIVSLDATQKFGDFSALYPGRVIEPLFAETGRANQVVASSINRRKGQYRVFFNDKKGIYYSPAGITEVAFPNQVAVAHSAELSSGDEQNLIGDTLGLVHRLDSGHGFNGVAIRGFITLAFTDLGAPSVRKRFRRVFWDIRSGSDASLWIQPDYDFGSNETGRPRRSELDFNLGGGIWNVSKWGEFYWSIPSVGQEPVDVAGTGTSINFSIYSESLSSPHELLGYDLHFDPRRQRRG